MYLGPELVFPLVLSGLLFCLLRLVGPGGTFFGRPIRPAVVALIFFLPIFYGVMEIIPRTLPAYCSFRLRRLMAL